MPPGAIGIVVAAGIEMVVEMEVELRVLFGSKRVAKLESILRKTWTSHSTITLCHWPYIIDDDDVGIKRSRIGNTLGLGILCQDSRLILNDSCALC